MSDREARRAAEKDVAQNRRAFHEYHVLDQLEAGMVLTGTEVKSLRDGRAQLKDSYVVFEGGAPWLVGAHISAFTHGNRENHEPERKRKLLMGSQQIKKWYGRVTERGNTIVPLRIYFKGSRAKVEIALVSGKKLHDKRDTLRQRQLDKETAVAIKERTRG